MAEVSFNVQSMETRIDPESNRLQMLNSSRQHFREVRIVRTSPPPGGGEIFQFEPSSIFNTHHTNTYPFKRVVFSKAS